MTYNQKYDPSLKVYDKVPCIYKITSPTGRIYIGQTTNLLARILKYRHAQIDQYKLYCSINKYGFDNHKIEVICIATLENIDELEIFYIKEYDSHNNGLNSTDGGKNAKLTDNQKNRIRRKNQGKKLSSETKLKMKEAFEKYGYPMQGKRHSEETKLKLSEINKKTQRHPNSILALKESAKNRLGKKRDKSVCDKISKTKKEFFDKNRFLDGWDLSKRFGSFLHKRFLLAKNKELNYSGVFSNFLSVAGSLHLDGVKVRQCLHGKLESYKGYSVQEVKMYF